MDGILASIFLGFWSILGAKLGGKPEPRSTQKAIEKRCKKEEQRDCQKSRNKNPQPRHAPRVLGPGEGVGGGVNPSPEQGKEEVLAERRTYPLNHLSPEGWWDWGRNHREGRQPPPPPRMERSNLNCAVLPPASLQSGGAFAVRSPLWRAGV